MRIGPAKSMRPGRLLLAIAITMTACSPDADPSRAVSAEEDRQLNEAAASLDANAAVLARGENEDDSR